MLHSFPENDGADRAATARRALATLATLEAIDAMTDAALPTDPIVTPEFIRDAMEDQDIGSNLLHTLLAKLREGETQVVYEILHVPVSEMSSRGFGGTLADRWRPLLLAVECIRADTIGGLSRVAPEFREPALMIVEQSRPELVLEYKEAPRKSKRRQRR